VDRRATSALTHAADDLPRRLQRARPVIAVAHAVRPIEEHDDLARPRRARPGRVLPAQERTRERKHDQRERGQPQHQEQPVPDAPPLDGLIGDLPQEHQRRELDHVLPLALDQVQKDRDGEAPQGDQEEWGQQ
jgi:hypothetical protein